MPEMTGKSGAKIVINPAPFEDAINLKNAVEREIVNSRIDPEKIESSIGLLPIILHVDGSPEVNAALWPCLIRCTYNAQKITKTTFDDVKARADYYDIVMACWDANNGPLVAGLCSRLSPLGINLTRQNAPQK